MVPAARALGPGVGLHRKLEALGREGRAAVRHQVHAGDHQQILQGLAQRGQQGLQLGLEGQAQAGIQAGADLLGGPHGLQLLVQGVLDAPEERPGLLLGHAHAFREPLLEDVALGTRDVLPDLVRREGEDGGHEDGEARGQAVADGAAGAPAGALQAVAVEAVLDDLEVPAGELQLAEGEERLGHLEVVVAAVALADLLAEVQEGVPDPAVQRGPLGFGHRVLRGVVVRQGAQQEAQGVADLAVGVGVALEDVLGDAHVLAEVHIGHPQAQDVRAVGLHHLVRGDDVAQALAHGLALAVQHEAVGHDGVVGLLAGGGQAEQQGAVEPAAVLVGALQVDVLAVVLHAQLGAGLGGHHAADAGVDPDIQDVRLLLEDLAAALGAFRARGLQLLHGQLRPDLDALLLDGGGRLLEDVLVHQRLAALRAAQYGDGRSPGALAADAPVGTARDHGVDAVAALGRHPLGGVDALQAQLAQALAGVEELVVHDDEPLLRGPEEDGCLGAPAVGIAVDQLLLVQEGADGLQTVHHQRIGIEDVLAFQLGVVHRRHEAAVGPHQLQEPEVVGQVEVVHAVIGGGVHQARARVGGHVVGHQHRALPVDPGVPVGQGLELDALADLAGVELHAQLLLEVLQQRDGHDVVAVARLHHRVLHVRVHGDGQVAGQGPGRGGPDGEVEGGRQLQLAGHLVLDREGHGDGVAGLVGVLHLGLGQGGARAVAPVHHLQLARHCAALEEAPQEPDHAGFVAGLHGDVGVVPGAQHPQALEARALGVDPLLGVGPALGQELGPGHLPALGAQVLLHRVLDGQAVAVPARHVGRLVAVQPERLDDDVLQDLVERVAHVDGAVGVGRPVVQDAAALPLSGGIVRAAPGLDLLVHPVGLPPLHPLRFPLGQIRLHGEVRPGKENGILLLHVAHGALVRQRAHPSALIGLNVHLIVKSPGWPEPFAPARAGPGLTSGRWPSRGGCPGGSRTTRPTCPGR